MRVTVAIAVVVAQLSLSGMAQAQSLGELALKEEARRKTVKTPSKVYTNDSLRAAAPPAPSTAPSSAAQSLTPPPDDSPAAPAPAAQVRDEKYWRGRIDAARTALTRSQTLVDALQSRINALSADFVNRDDPAQRNVVAAQRQEALAELDRVKQEIAAQQKAIADTQEEARRANVPAGWVR